MNLKIDGIISHDYCNTGGGCMVSIFKLKDSESNKVYYIFVNEELITLAKQNYIMEVDYEPDMEISTYPHNMIGTSHNSELFKYCIDEFLKKEEARFKQFFKERNIPC